jgi:hypothetical protein
MKYLLIGTIGNAGSELSTHGSALFFILAAAYGVGFCIESAQLPDAAQPYIWHIWASLMI